MNKETRNKIRAAVLSAYEKADCDHITQDAQHVEGEWYNPKWGCDTLDQSLDALLDAEPEPGDENPCAKHNGCKECDPVCFYTGEPAPSDDAREFTELLLTVAGNYRYDKPQPAFDAITILVAERDVRRDAGLVEKIMLAADRWAGWREGASLIQCLREAARSTG